MTDVSGSDFPLLVCHVPCSVDPDWRRVIHPWKRSSKWVKLQVPDKSPGPLAGAGAGSLMSVRGIDFLGGRTARFLLLAVLTCSVAQGLTGAQAAHEQQHQPNPGTNRTALTFPSDTSSRFAFQRKLPRAPRRALITLVMSCRTGGPFKPGFGLSGAVQSRTESCCRSFVVSRRPFRLNPHRSSQPGDVTTQGPSTAQIIALR